MVGLPGPVLVVGGTGATGRHVVQQLLNHGRRVTAIVRSEEQMRSLVNLPEESRSSSDSRASSLLSLTEASLLDLSDDDLYEHVKDVEAVVVCLGHNGIFVEPKRLVLESVTRLSKAMIRASNASDSGLPGTSRTPKKLVVMLSVGVPNPDGTDAPRRWLDRALLQLFLYALPPHMDNVETGQYVHSLGKESGIEWAIVRPTDLIDGDASPFRLFDTPQGHLFQDGVTTRANVANAMVDLITDPALWETHKFRMPTIYNHSDDAPSDDAAKEDA